MVGCLLKGTDAELPTHAAYLTDFLYYSTDNGNLYWDNGSAWVLLQGATKAEVMQNKILSASNNTILGVQTDPFYSAKREGYIRPAITAAASLEGTLKGLSTSGGTYSYFYDTTEGFVSRFSTAAIAKIGWASDTSPVTTRREWATRLKVRMRATTTGSTSIFMGFVNSDAVIINANVTPIGTADNGILLGFNGQNNFFNSYRNDGQGGTSIVQSFGVTKDTNFHTFEMIMSDSNIVCTLDGGNTQTLTTQIPLLTTDMKMAVQCHALDTVSRSFDVSKAIYQSDFV